jgi:large subunit ribosomal protein L9
MEIILKKDVDNLGYTDDLVTVKNGYARNYLIPNGLAVLASPSAKKVRSENLKQRAHREAKLREEAEAMGAKLAAATIKVGAKVGESGMKIFGSVNNIQVAEAIKAALGVEVDRKKISLKGDVIKEIGSYTASVRLHKDFAQEFTFEVVAE